MEAVNLDLQPQHILLAEDDDDLRELLNFSLVRAGYLVTSCSNGLELLDRLLHSQDFQLVISDLRMPALTGLEVLEYLHDIPQRPPFLCMTAFGDPRTHEAAYKLGAAATIDKPFDLDQLLHLVQSICPRSGQSLTTLSLRSRT
jgi:CheY-like chemotaxis protein